MNHTRESLYQLLCETYLPAFLSFARSRTGEIYAAEELAQEIACRCVEAIVGGRIREDADKYFWSVAHNTCKSYLARKQPLSLEEHNLFAVLPSDDVPMSEQMAEAETIAQVRAALSRLSGQYREVLVSYYYENLSVAETARALSLSESMVKFYLRTGREKLKEVYLMSSNPVSVKPAEFSVYKSSIDFSRVNVWEVFRRKLPGQLAILCHDKPMTVSALSVETGVPAVYLEEELALLLDAGVMISPVKDKFRTNFHILRAQSAAQVKAMCNRMFRDYIPRYRSIYEETLPALKNTGAFRYDAGESAYRWYFYGHTAAMDERGMALSAQDYPQILSCGSKAIVFAMEAPILKFSAGRTPTFLDGAAVYPCDVTAFGEYHRQRELRDTDKAQLLYDIARGRTPADDDETRLRCAALAEEGYIEKHGDHFVSRVPVTDSAVRALFSSVNEQLSELLAAPTEALLHRVSDIVRSTIPPQLSDYVHGFTVTWMIMLAGSYFAEALYEDGFLPIPEADDQAPYNCEIVIDN